MSISEKNNDHNEAPVNEGWQQMQSMLDVHLPAEKKNRKAIVWWWLPVSFVVTILMVKFLFFNDSHLPVSTNEKTKVATIEKEAGKIIESKSEVPKVESASKAMVIVEIKSDEQKLILMSKVASNDNKTEDSTMGLNKTNAKKNSADKNNATFVQKQSRKQQLNKIEKVNTQFNHAEEQNTETAVNQPMAADSSDISIDDKMEKMKMDTTIGTNNTDTSIAKKSNADSTNNYQATDIIPLLTKPKKSIYLGVDALPFQALSFGMQWPINKTFSFDLSVNDIVKSNLFKSKNQPQYFLQNISYHPQMMNYISINAGINTHLLPKWDLALQPFFALLTHTSGNVYSYLNAQGNSVTTLLSASIANTSGSRAKFRTSIFEKNQTPYNNFDFGLRLSTAFHINNKWSATASYQFGMNPIAKKEYLVFKDNILVSGYNSAAYNRFFTIGCRYKIR